jgi:GNAT superfamily N-acetyltransferase
MIAPVLIVPRDPGTRLRLSTAADEAFVRKLYKGARAGDFAAANLPPAALDMLLEQQFRAQAAGYAALFPEAQAFIILHRDAPVGRLILVARLDRWLVVDIMLRPEVRNRGIGGDVIAAVARTASTEGARELALSVLINNSGARRLYARLGFAETGADGAHIAMSRPLGA